MDIKQHLRGSILSELWLAPAAYTCFAVADATVAALRTVSLIRDFFLDDLTDE